MPLTLLKTSLTIDFYYRFEISYSTEQLLLRTAIFDTFCINVQYFPCCNLSLPQTLTFLKNPPRNLTCSQASLFQNTFLKVYSL